MNDVPTLGPSQVNFALNVDSEPRMIFIHYGWLEYVRSWALDERRASWVLRWQVRCVCCHLRLSILQTWDQFWVAMEVTYTNFESLLPRIEEALTNCHFCAIDAEFSGLSLTNPRWVHVKKNLQHLLYQIDPLGGFLCPIPRSRIRVTFGSCFLI